MATELRTRSPALPSTGADVRPPSTFPAEPGGGPSGRTGTRPYRLTTLGGFRLEAEGVPLDLGAGKLCALLAFLAADGAGPSSREKLMALLWGSHFDLQARQNLRKAISRMRAVLGEGVVAGNDDQVWLLPGTIETDTARFGKLAADGTLAALAEAVEIGRGEYLAGLAIEQSGWADWLAGQRRRLDACLVDVLVRLGHHELVRGSNEAALDLGRRAVANDPLREDAHRLVISGLAALGRRSEALRAYDEFAELLRAELAIQPDGNTQAVAEAIRRTDKTRPEGGSANAAARRDGQREMLSIPSRPTLAVLPFDCAGDATGADYLGSGLVDEVIAALSGARFVQVISRSSSASFRDRSADPRDVGRELGVRYVIEGQIRGRDGRIRVSTQLIDAATGLTLAAHRYDRMTRDMPDLEDELTAQIVADLVPGVRASELERLKRKPPDSFDAYDLYLRSLPDIYAVTEASWQRAEEALRRSIELDPTFSDALASLANLIGHQLVSGWRAIEFVDESREEALALAQRAMAADPRNGFALASAAYILAAHQNRFDEGIVLAERAVRMQPHSDEVLAACGTVMVNAGELDRALELFERARALNPLDAQSYAVFTGIGRAHFHAGRFAEAESALTRALAERTGWALARRYRAAALAYLGRVDQARAEIRALLADQPNASLARSSLSLFRCPDMLEQYVGGLRLAGLPES